MFYLPAARLSSALKWFPMFGLDETNQFMQQFSFYKQMSYCLATSTNIRARKGTNHKLACMLCVLHGGIIWAVVGTKYCMDTVCSMFDQALFALLGTEHFAGQTSCWDNKI